MGLFLVPARTKNIAQSIRQRVLPDFAARFLSPEELAEIEARAGIEGIRCWAMTQPALFRAMQPGDDVLLSEAGTGKFTWYGQVTWKTENEPFGEALWPFVGEKPWALIYFLRNLRPLDIPKAEVVMRLGYLPEYQVAGTNRVDDKRLADFESRHGRIVDWLGIDSRRDEFPTAEEPGPDYSSTNVDVLAKRRVGQEAFARTVKANYGWACAMCGISHRDFLVGSHISSWAKDEENRLKPENGICLCVLHDRAFERGYLLIDDDYKIRLNPILRPASPLYDVLRPVADRSLSKPRQSPPDRELLKRHRETFLLQF